MKTLSADPHTGTTRTQPDESTRCNLCYIALLEYDLKIRRQHTAELVRELGGDRGYKSRVQHTAKLCTELIGYEGYTSRVKKTGKVVKECNDFLASQLTIPKSSRLSQF